MPAVSSYPLETADPTEFLLGTTAAGDVVRFIMLAVRNVWRSFYEITGTAQANSPTNSQTISDGTKTWTHTCVAGKSYNFMATGTFSSGVATAGVRLSLLGAGSVAGQVNGFAAGALAQATVATGLEATLFALGTVNTAWPTGSFLLTTAVSPINSPHHFKIEFKFRCTTGGTISIQAAPEVAATITINPGSALIVEELN
ncbi:MAG: hypothetical protein H0W39_06705 [Sphingomonas sp.]|nr:hypothetical protein [Sphingomonas sp.]